MSAALDAHIERANLSESLRRQRDNHKSRLDQLTGDDFHRTRERVRDLTKVCNILRSNIVFTT